MTIFLSRLCIVDTETTGFQNADWSRVIELGAVILDNDGSELAAYESLVLPDILDERANGALAVNRIDIDHIRANGKEPVVVVEEFRAFLANHNCKFVTAYNVDFDRKMLDRMGLGGLKWANCIMRKFKEINGGRGRLADAAARFGVVVEGEAHRALTDARTAAGVAVGMAKCQ